MPYRPIVKRTGAAVAGIGAQIGQTISDLPAKIAAEKKSKSDEEQREAYLKAVKKDSSLLDLSQKSLKKTYAEYAKPLVDKGVISQAEMDANLKSFPIARETDKLNDVSLDNYRKNLGKKFNELMVDAQNRSKKYQTDKTISGEMAPKTQVKAGAPVEDPQSMKTMPVQGGPGQEQGAITETDITERPAEWETTQAAPKTQQELKGRVNVADPSITGKEVEGSTAFGSLQSQEHLDRKEAAELKETQRLAKEAKDDERWDAGFALRVRNTKAREKSAGLKVASDYQIKSDKLKKKVETSTDDINSTYEDAKEEKVNAANLQKEYDSLLAKQNSPSQKSMAALNPARSAELQAEVEATKKKLNIANKAIKKYNENMDKLKEERELQKKTTEIYQEMDGNIAISEAEKLAKEALDNPQEVVGVPQPVADTAPSAAPTPKKTKTPLAGPPPATKQPSPKIRTQQEKDQAAITWARDTLKTDPKNDVALRILKLNKVE